MYNDDSNKIKALDSKEHPNYGLRVTTKFWLCSVYFFLFTLRQLGIAANNVSSTGTTGEVTGNFTTDTFHSLFSGHPDTTAVANLPDMQACPERSRRGSGAVRELRDLRKAANDYRWRMAA